MTTTVQNTAQKKIIDCVSAIHGENSNTNNSEEFIIEKTNITLKNTQKSMASDFMKYQNNFIELQRQRVNKAMESARNKMKEDGKSEKHIDRSALKLKILQLKNDRLNKVIKVY
jgi:hypothetical protein